LRTYEALYIVSPEVAEDDIQTVVKDVDDLVTKHEGTIVRSEIWGKRKLAYSVKQQTEGIYVLLRFTASQEFIARMTTYFRLSETIIRFLITHFDEPTLRLEAEQQRRKEEDVRQGVGGKDRDDDDDEIIPRSRRKAEAEKAAAADGEKPAAEAKPETPVEASTDASIEAGTC
jgi:small subunit ribosomal protein S6